MKQPFSYESIGDHFRIRDANDNRVATCYDEANAVELVGRLNATLAPLLLDRFAGQAMQAELMTSGVPGEAGDALVEAANVEGRTVEEQVAWNSYSMAAAMLRERQSRMAVQP